MVTLSIVKVLVNVDHSSPTPYSITACAEDRSLFTAYFREMPEVIAAGVALGALAEVGFSSWGQSPAQHIAQQINSEN